MNGLRGMLFRWMGHVILRTAPILIVFGACETLQAPEEPEGSENPTPLAGVLRDWQIWKLTNDERFDERVDEGRDQIGDAILISAEIGSLVRSLPVSAPDSIARAEIFSNETGETYWVGVQAPAPSGLTAPDSVVGGVVFFDQEWRFRKDSPDATFQLIILDVFVEVYDGNGVDPSPDQCTWAWWADTAEWVYVCEKLMRGSISAGYWVRRDTGEFPFFTTEGAAIIEGWGTAFRRDVEIPLWTHRPLFELTDFELDPPGQDPYQTMRLRAPITVDIPLDSIAVGDAFEIGTNVVARVWNRRQGESYVGAYFRDPAATTGIALEFEGVTMLDPPSESREPSRTTSPAPACSETGSGGAGGTIQFEASSYLWPEWRGNEAAITVTRTGGSDGEASVAFATGGGTATVGSDYEELTTHVRFADGEEGARVAYVAIIADTIAEPNETVSLALSSPGGCATLGGLTSAELTIMDDDQPPPDRSHAIGGTVTGLEGSGLVLTNLFTDPLSVTADGAFAFAREYVTGSPYEVRVATQPANPLQVCTVSNGSGEVQDADVTDVEVVCVTPPPTDESFDLGFGVDGRVTEGSAFAWDVALQSDGRIVLAGRQTLARYNADGSADASFGAGGEVTVEFSGDGDAATAVAVQADGRIVVAGHTRPASDHDFALARFNSDGSPDLTFGSGGQVTTDFSGGTDQAWDIAIQGDGSIVVVGHAATSTTNNDFAVARYTSAGSLDPSFGGGGTAMTGIAGGTDLAYAVGLQPDGKIVLAGRVGDTGGDLANIGLVRYNADGSLDPGFGAGGIAEIVTDQVDDWAEDMVLQPDGNIVVAGHTKALGIDETRHFLVARFDASGRRDTGFGSVGDGYVTTPFSSADDFAYGVALQADGKIVAVGQMSNTMTPNFAVARLDADGALDSEFANQGTLFVDFFGADDRANAVVIQDDGKAVVAGWAYNGTRQGLGLLRVLP